MAAPAAPAAPPARPPPPPATAPPKAAPPGLAPPQQQPQLQLTDVSSSSSKGKGKGDGGPERPPWAFADDFDKLKKRVAKLYVADAETRGRSMSSWSSVEDWAGGSSSSSADGTNAGASDTTADGGNANGQGNSGQGQPVASGGRPEVHAMSEARSDTASEASWAHMAHDVDAQFPRRDDGAAGM